MKRPRKLLLALMLLALTFTLCVSGAVTASAASYSNLTVSKNGEDFKITRDGESLSFRFDWDEAKDTYTGYDREQIRNFVAPGILVPGMNHEGSPNTVQYIMAGKLMRINGKLRTGMSLKAFNRKVKKAWGKGYYTYQNKKTKNWVKIGSRMPSKKDFKKGNLNTFNWVGMRGKVKMNAFVRYNPRKNKATISLFAIYGSEADKE